MRDEDFIRSVDRYLKGRMTQSEADVFWEEMLRNPELLSRLEAAIAARDYFRNQPPQSNEPDERRPAAVSGHSGQERPE